MDESKRKALKTLLGVGAISSLLGASILTTELLTQRHVEVVEQIINRTIVERPINQTQVTQQLQQYNTYTTNYWDADAVVYTKDGNYYAVSHDGTTICTGSPTACIQEAINYVINNKTSGVVLIRSGTYTVSSEILINDPSPTATRSYSVTIVGEYSATIQTTTPTTTLGYNNGIFHFTSVGGVKEINIEGLNLSLTDSSKSFSNVISIELSGNATAPQTWRIKIRNNRITSNYQVNSSGGYTQGILIMSREVAPGYSPVPVDFDVWIENNRVVGVGEGITVANYSVQGPASGRVVVRNNFVDTQWTTGAGTDDIFVFGNGEPPNLQYFIPDVIIEGNTALNPGDTAIEVAQAINAVIRGNTANGPVHLSYNWINGIVENNAVYGGSKLTGLIGAYTSGTNIGYIRNTIIQGNSLYNATINVYLDLSQLSSPIDIGPISILNNNLLFENLTLSRNLMIIQVASSNWSNYPKVLIQGNNIRVNNVNANSNTVYGIAYGAPQAVIDVSHNAFDFTGVTNASNIVGINLNNGYPAFIRNNIIKGSTQWLQVNYWGPYYVSHNYVDNTNVSIGSNITVYFRRNTGYPTEASGVATIASGSTSVTVNHGLVCTPSKVLITPLAQPSGNLWVSNITSTSFTINISSAPSTNLPVAWLAEC